VFLGVTITLVAVTPAVLDAIKVLPEIRGVLEGGRWLLLLGGLIVSIAVLMRIAPARPGDPPRRFIGKGVLIASVMWVLVSLGFSIYVDNFGNYGETYGALAGVVVLQLWLWIGIYALLLGSAIEAVREDAPLEEEAAEVIEG
jgi:membrane protein